MNILFIALAILAFLVSAIVFWWQSRATGNLVDYFFGVYKTRERAQIEGLAALFLGIILLILGAIAPP